MEAGERLIREREREREWGKVKPRTRERNPVTGAAFLQLLGFDDNRGGGPEKLNFAAAQRG